MSMPSPLIRWLGCRCNLLKCYSWKLSVRSVAYTTSPDTNVLSHPIETQKLGKFKITYQWKRERMSALLFARQLKYSGFKHNVETYMAIVRLLCKSGMTVRLNHFFMYIIQNTNNRESIGFEMSDLLEALIEEKLIKAIEVLVKLYASIGKFVEAMQILLEMRSIKTILRVSPQTCNFLIKKLIEWDRVDMLELAYRQLRCNGLLIPNVDTYGLLIKGYCREGSKVQVLNVFQEMVEAGDKLNNAYITGMFIHGLCSIVDTDYAFQAVKKMRECGNQTVDVHSYTCLIRGYVRESKLQYAEHVLLHDMKMNTQVVPDENCYAALIQGYWEKGDTDKAFDLRKEMESRLGVDKTDNVVARSMMQSLGHGEALCKFKGFMESGVFDVDGMTFNMGIDIAACKLGKMEDAMGLVQEWMKGGKMKLLKMHYRTLIEGYCLNGEPLNALYMFQEMMRNGFRPDSTTYYVLARGGVNLPLYMLFKFY